MNSSTKAVKATALLGQSPRQMMAAACKHLRHEGNPNVEWPLLSEMDRNLFVQWEPTPPTLTATLHDLALYRFVTQRT